MSVDTCDKVNWKRVEELLLKENFRRLIIKSGKADSYILDTVGYTAAPNVIACFQDNNIWKVYETDDRSNVRDERTFDSAGSAYKDAAARRGLIFSALIDIPNKKNNDTVVPMHKRKYEIQTALQNAIKLAEILAGEKSGEVAAEDVKVLDAALKELRKSSNRITIGFETENLGAFSRTAERVAGIRIGYTVLGKSKPRRVCRAKRTKVYSDPIAKTARVARSPKESRAIRAAKKD